MSRLFGPMRQVGIVVRDIERAMRHWVEVCGVGPWFYAERLPLTEFRYKGRVYDINMSVALANSGDVQLELIQQRCDSPSLYRDFLAAGHEGMQHWSSWPVNYHEIRRTGAGERLADRPGGRHAARAVHLFPQRRPPRHDRRDGRGDADPHAHLRPGARGRAELGRQRPDPAELAAGVKAGVKATPDQHSACLLRGGGRRLLRERALPRRAPADGRTAMDLNGAVAVVTGGNGGLGQRICHALAREGVHVAVMYAQSRDQAEGVARELASRYQVNAAAFACDMTDGAAVERAGRRGDRSASAASISSSTTPPTTRRSRSPISTA